MNATYTSALDGTLTITHDNCGGTTTAKPIYETEDGYVGYGSDADFCAVCGDGLSY